MSHFVIQPNLPVDVDTIIIGQMYFDSVGKALILNGFTPINLPDNPIVDPRIRGHADISALHTGENLLFLADYLKKSTFSDSLCALGADVHYTDELQSAEYPNDAQLNMCLLGSRLFFNKKSASASAVNYLTHKKRIFTRNVHQGYTRCSVCIINENSLITADKGIGTAAKKDGIDVLMINPGGIALDGFEYGFIGGSAFKLRRDLIAFTGRIDEHPDADRIKYFISQHKMDILYLTDEQIFDIGGAVPITEK